MNIEDINYKEYEITTPFPKLDENNPKDAKTASMIIDAYAGSKGELTASTQYIYQSFIVEPLNEHFHRLLELIAIKEMQHLEILSQILINQGVNPKFCKYIDNNINICNNWSTSNIKYITNIIEFLKYNILLEKDAIKEYTNIIEKTPINNIKEIIARIIEDEKSHLRLFNKMLEIYENIQK